MLSSGDAKEMSQARESQSSTERADPPNCGHIRFRPVSGAKHVDILQHSDAFPAFLHDEVDPSSTEAEQQRAKQQQSNGDESNEDGTVGPQRRFGDPHLPMESDGNCKCWYKLYG